MRGSPLDGLNLEAVLQWAWYTADRDVSNNQLKFNEDARDLGFEVDLNVDSDLPAPLPFEADWRLYDRDDFVEN